MLNKRIIKIIEDSKKTGWVLEPDAKSIFRSAGFDVPEFAFAGSFEEARSFASGSGYPVVAKVVSPQILHKSDVGGVAVGIGDEDELKKVFERFSSMPGYSGAVVEEMVAGTELIVGAKVDLQFGPVVLLGIGGIGVELYSDTVIRMAPLEEKDVAAMLAGIKAKKVIEGFRGSEPVDKGRLTAMMVEFSRLVMEMEAYIESIDLNPVMCSGSRCIIADARIILAKNAE